MSAKYQPPGGGVVTETDPVASAAVTVEQARALAAEGALQAAAATDSELAAAIATVNSSVAAKQDAATAATDAELAAAMAALRTAPATRFPRVAVGGHSFVSGYLLAEGPDRFADRVAAALHAELVIYGHTSAALAVDDSSSWPGGYASIVNGFRPKTQSPATSADRTAAPYLPLAPAVAFFYGINDVAKLGATAATNIAWFKMALRAITCMARCGGIFVDTHASVAFSGGWSSSQTLPKFGSVTSRSTSTVGSSVTITVPADFPGGEVDLFTRAYNTGGPKWSTTVDGGAAQVLDGTGSAFGASAARGNLMVQRLTGLSAGAHTIVMTLAAVDTSPAAGFFDSWGIVAPGTPTVALCNHPAASPGLPWTAGGAHDPVTTADVQALNVVIGALPAEFTDGHVVLADVSAYFAAAAGNVAKGQPGSLFQSDGIHPNSRGHALIAQAVTDALDAAPTLTAGTRFSTAGFVMRPVKPNGNSSAWPFGGDPALAANWSITAGGTAAFGRDRGGNVVIQLDLSRTAGQVVGETIFFLPPGYAPATDQFLTAVSWDVGQTTPTPGLCMAKANGNVVWLSGTPLTRLEVSGSFPATGLPNN